VPGIIDEYLPSEEPAHPPRFDSSPVKLEIRGTTPQADQQLLWSRNTIYKNSVAAKLREAGRFLEAGKLEHCHTEYTFAVCSGCGQVNKFPNRCDLFYCAECQPRLSHDRKKAVEWWTREVNQPKHVVLTVKNVAHLDKQHVQEFRSWLTRLRRSAFASNWLGGFYTLEVTNEGQGWHLHAHLLVDAKWIDAIQLSAKWSQITKGFGRIVKVKDARGKDYLAEVTKYVVKGVQLAAWSGADLVTFINAFDGVRTFGVFGSLYGKRTKFAEWWKSIRGSTPKCDCGCCTATYFSESQFIEWDLLPNREVKPIPPPAIPVNQLHFSIA
jgi:hypothetical protein